MTRDKKTADLLGVIKDLLAMPEYDATTYTSKIRRETKHRARRLVEEYEREPCKSS